MRLHDSDDADPFPRKHADPQKKCCYDRVDISTFPQIEEGELQKWRVQNISAHVSGAAQPSFLPRSWVPVRHLQVVA